MELQMLMVDKLSKNSIFVKNDFYLIRSIQWTASGAGSGRIWHQGRGGQSVQCVFYIFELNLLGGVGVGLVQAIQNWLWPRLHQGLGIITILFILPDGCNFAISRTIAEVDRRGLDCFCQPLPSFSSPLLSLSSFSMLTFSFHYEKVEQGCSFWWHFQLLPHVSSFLSFVLFLSGSACLHMHNMINIQFACLDGRA